ncbi:MAG: 6,7-dimethyl-8-ribityllumazine synthase [Chitinispirillaceae bacterium]|nr:6,7-dimethyl-8-ribityllumazine synthase [Chitinispirillaceae bacterium]
MPAVIEGILDGSGKRFGIVVSRFNELISKKLLEGALDCLLRHKVDKEAIAIVWTPGALEIPLVAKKMAMAKQYDALLCLGAVIRGGTPHFDYVASEMAKGIAKVALESGMPVINGVLTTETIDQAVERAGAKSGNKGWDAALNAVEMVDLMGRL